MITPDRAACSRYGLNVGDVNGVVQAAIGGQAVTQVLQGERAFNLVVRWQPKYRESLDAIRQIRIAQPSGAYVQLDQVADIKHARYYWLLLAESHLTRRLFASMLGKIAALPMPAG
jgi:cobalt-zinc-cadmium resistance protein CzcA